MAFISSACFLFQIGYVCILLFPLFLVSSAAESDTKSDRITLSPVNGTAKETSHGYDNKTDEFQNSNYDQEAQNNANRETVPSPTPNTENSISWYFKVTWLFQNICFAGALFVTILFWVLDFDPATSTVTVFNVHIHGVNLVFVILDQFLIASPFRLLHFIYPSCMALIYFIFTGIYFAAGGLNEYPEDPVNGNTYLYQGTLDWGRHPTTSVVTMVLVVFVAAPVIHLLYFGLYHLRRSFRRCCECCRNVDEIWLYCHSTNNRRRDSSGL